MSTNSWYRTKGSPPFYNVMLDGEIWSRYVHGYDFGKIRPDKIVLHHTAVPTVDQWAGLKSMQGMQSYYHTSAPGAPWPSGPHIYAAPDGIWLATPMADIGTHARWCNATYITGRLIGYSIGLEMVGNYTRTKPTGAVWSNALEVMGSLCVVLNTAPRDLITFHRYCGKPECPGDAVDDEWVWRSVERWIADAHGTVYGAWRCLVPALIHEGPDETFKVSGSLGHDIVIITDTETDDFVHMANLRPLQFDVGFVRKSGQLVRL